MGYQVVQKLDEGYRLPKPNNCPQQLYNIMQKCWNAEPKERPTFETLHWQLEDYIELDSSSYTDASDFVK